MKDPNWSYWPFLLAVYLIVLGGSALLSLPVPGWVVSALALVAGVAAALRR